MLRRDVNICVLKWGTKRTNYPQHKAENFSNLSLLKFFSAITLLGESNWSFRMELSKLFTYNYIKRLILFSLVTQMSLGHQHATEVCTNQHRDIIYKNKSFLFNIIYRQRAYICYTYTHKKKTNQTKKNSIPCSF